MSEMREYGTPSPYHILLRTFVHLIVRRMWLHFVNPCWLILFLPQRTIRLRYSTWFSRASIGVDVLGEAIFSCPFGVPTSLVHQVTHLRVECSKDTICACTTYFNEMSSIMHCQIFYFTAHIITFRVEPKDIVQYRLSICLSMTYVHDCSAYYTRNRLYC